MRAVLGKKILIVEDEIELLELITRELRQSGLQVAAARNGEEGLEAALAERPDLILTDMLMPVMDGITMLKKIREDASGKNLKAIVLTNLSDSSITVRISEVPGVKLWIKSDLNLAEISKKVLEELRGENKSVREL
ncbi:MAG: hypothetical protein A2751_00755 [Candidatus Doudnabacteria bacterium RIFCSPHIGHO2_01_FULL_46_14]|uniref:Response regulatory domain-containing protein n=1 Tax=Candidatus Doudnabacteria bacterium RIFCSPHIGHO2_01_FULL_46_14 TaxID=1817824 RepID=A0A1F5NMR7_9BACT|nr:MAG: hypothetical protein A2751_00755 [Candidatus Doudnabacteria bacterium RIFCSPHIGHO2_01_FULL_46_14]